MGRPVEAAPRRLRVDLGEGPGRILDLAPPEPDRDDALAAVGGDLLEPARGGRRTVVADQVDDEPAGDPVGARRALHPLQHRLDDPGGLEPVAFS